MRAPVRCDSLLPFARSVSLLRQNTARHRRCRRAAGQCVRQCGAIRYCPSPARYRSCGRIQPDTVGAAGRPVNACASAVRFVTALRPLGIGGASPLTLRARCISIRYCLALLGFVPAVKADGQWPPLRRWTIHCRSKTTPAPVHALSAGIARQKRAIQRQAELPRRSAYPDPYSPAVTPPSSVSYMDGKSIVVNFSCFVNSKIPRRV